MKWFASLVILMCVGFFGGEVWAKVWTNQLSAEQRNTLDEAIRTEQNQDSYELQWTSTPTSLDPTTPSPSQSELSSKGFMFKASTISPSSKVYNKGLSESGGGEGNVKTLLARIANILLIVVSTGAVLSIIIGGFFMVTSAGDTEKANRGKIIITYNIIAVCIAMLSYGIIQFVIWVIGVPS